MLPGPSSTVLFREGTRTMKQAVAAFRVLSSGFRKGIMSTFLLVR
jgi:hypothetical protein